MNRHVLASTIAQNSHAGLADVVVVVLVLVIEALMNDESVDAELLLSLRVGLVEGVLPQDDGQPADAGRRSEGQRGRAKKKGAFIREEAIPLKRGTENNSGERRVKCDCGKWC